MDPFGRLSQQLGDLTLTLDDPGTDLTGSDRWGRVRKGHRDIVPECPAPDPTGPSPSPNGQILPNRPR